MFDITVAVISARQLILLISQYVNFSLCGYVLGKI